MTIRAVARTAFVTALALGLPSTPAQASCGCEKPPPVAAAIRPSFAFPARDLFSPCDLTRGGCVALFGDRLVAGQTYGVEFRHGNGHTRRVDAVARRARDLADGAWRAQLWVPVPPKSPLGPASIEVRDDAGGVVLDIPDTDFTVIAPPVVVPEAGGMVVVDKYRGAVGHDGTLYVALDVSGILPQVELGAKGYALALHYRKDDMVIYNTQGVLMEALSSAVRDEDVNNDGDSNDPGEGDWNHNGLVDNPDISQVVSDDGGDSDGFFYSRHAFETYDAQHQPGMPHALDPTDNNWHVDGTRHTDTFHFVAAIGGAVLNGEALTPGATDPFTLMLDALVAPAAAGN